MNEIGVTLPTEVKLEYESGYAVMASRAIKNYALLSYGGEMIVCGTAMRPRRGANWKHTCYQL